jgi:4-hydroxy-3-methylbut-2-enyl diphosphate reductase
MDCLESMMKVIRADVMGMCFGVRDALQMIGHLGDPERVTIHGELVHNEAVLADLQARGFHMHGERQREAIPVTDTVLITAHGVSNAERRRLESAGKRLVDTTCPLVERAHHAALKLQAEGYHVLVIGRRGHVEVEGVVGDLLHYDVLESPDEVRRYAARRLGIMCQTTAAAAHVDRIRAAVANRNPDAEIRFIDTVCHPTKEHQKSLDRLLAQVQAIVIVGGRNSNNTRQLVMRCQENGVPAFHIQEAVNLRQEWFADVTTVGLTAGTSTLDTTIEQVYEALVRLKA